MYHARALPLPSNRRSPFAHALAMYHAATPRRNGLPDMEDLGPMVEFIGHTMLIDLQYGDPGVAATVFYGPDLTNYLDGDPEGVRFCDEPDQQYIRSLVLPHYQEARSGASPTFYEVTGPIRSHAYRYRRLLLPVNFMGIEGGGMVAVAYEVEPRRLVNAPPSAWAAALARLRDWMAVPNGIAIPATA